MGTRSCSRLKRTQLPSKKSDMSKGVTPRADTFIGIMILSLMSAFLMSWIATNYFGASTSSVLSFAQADGWCSSTNPGLGIHCFGDYGYTITLPLTDPYANWQFVPHSYPPLANAFFLPFRALAASGHGGIALALYEVVISLCLLVPILHLVHSLRPRLSGAAIAIAAVGPLTTPFLIAVDRGNNVCVLVPFIYIAYRAAMRGRFDLMVIVIVLMTNLRPQMILFAIVFLFARRYRHLLAAMLIAPVTLVMSFAMFGSSSITAFNHWLISISGYQDMTAFPTTYPYNLSLSNTVSWAAQEISSLLAISSNRITNWEDHTTLIGLAAIVLSCLAAWRAGHRKANLKYALLIATLLPVLATPTSFNYYLVVLFVPLAFVAADWLTYSSAPQRSYGRGVVSALSLARCRNHWEIAIWYCFVALSAVVLVPWPITMDLFPRGIVLGGSLTLLAAGPLIAITWIAAVVAMLSRGRFETPTATVIPEPRTIGR
jgi:hypothetical protein